MFYKKLIFLVRVVTVTLVAAAVENSVHIDIIAMLCSSNHDSNLLTLRKASQSFQGFLSSQFVILNEHILVAIVYWLG